MPSRGAARVGRVGGGGALVVDEVDQPSPCRRRRCARSDRSGCEKKPSKRSSLSCSSGPLKTLPSRADDDVAGGAREVLGLVVAQPVGADDASPPRRNSTSPSASASRSGRPRTSRARRMIGSRLAPRRRAAAAAATSARAQLDAGADAAASRRRWLRRRATRRAQAASAARARRMAAREPRRRRWTGILASGWTHWATRADAKSRAGCRARRRTRTCRGLGRARRFVESIIHEASASLAPPTARSPPHPELFPACLPSIAWADPARADAFDAWLGRVGRAHRPDRREPAPGVDRCELSPLPARRRQGGGSVIVMDAPPPQEDVRPFVHVAGLIAQAGLHAPRVLAQDDPEQAFCSSTTSAASSTRRRCRRAQARRRRRAPTR